jgi:hypothetical protein
LIFEVPAPSGDFLFCPEEVIDDAGCGGLWGWEFRECLTRSQLSTR